MSSGGSAAAISYSTDTIWDCSFIDIHEKTAKRELERKDIPKKEPTKQTQKRKYWKAGKNENVWSFAWVCHNTKVYMRFVSPIASFVAIVRRSYGVLCLLDTFFLCWSLSWLLCCCCVVVVFSCCSHTNRHLTS